MRRRLPSSRCSSASCDGVLSSNVNDAAPLKPAQSITFKPPAAPAGLATPVVLGASDRLSHLNVAPGPEPPVAGIPPAALPPALVPPVLVLPPALVPPAFVPPALVPPVPGEPAVDVVPPDATHRGRAAAAR